MLLFKPGAIKKYSAYPPLFYIVAVCYLPLPTQQCPQSIILGHTILGLYLMAKMGTLIVPPL
jgi:hypothetical protein